MSNDQFMPSNPALDALISECTDPEQIRELTKAFMESSGIISRTRGEDWGARLLRHPEPPPDVPLAATPAPVPTCSRVIYPHLNDRYEITGSSEMELDERERQIKAMFSGAR